MVMHARVRAEQGRLREADEAFRRALRLLIEEGFELSPAAGIVHIGMADLRYERNDLDGAERELERGVELAERTGDVSTRVWAYVTLSRTRRALGDEGSALEMAHKAERVARDSGADLQIAIAAAWLVRLRMARGDLAEAGALEQERSANADGAAAAARMVDQITSARLLHARGSAPRGAAAAGGTARSRGSKRAYARPHRDPVATGFGAVGVEREGAGGGHPRGSPRVGCTGGLRQDLRGRGSPYGHAPVGGARSPAERTNGLTTSRPGALPQEASGRAGPECHGRSAVGCRTTRTLE